MIRPRAGNVMIHKPGEPLLQVSDLVVSYSGLMAVKNVSFDIGRGELVGLIGPNGAGKTTLFNAISGYGRPASGSVVLDGRLITGWPPNRVAKLGVSRTYQNLRVFPTMTVFDNVSVGAIGALGYGWWRTLWPTDASGRAEQISERTWNSLERTRLTDVASELAGSLSYGKRKYLEIARALATHPKVLFLDEPAAGLNDTETSELRDFIRALNEEGITILVVEHDMNFIMSLCPRILVLAAGQLIEDGSPDAVTASEEVRRVYLGEQR
jgi:branched-chain amino acid transport system ATP-binding protein